MAKTTIRCIILLAAALLLTHAAAAEAQKIGELVNANKIEYTACKYKEAQMRDEARHYDSVKADLPGMEKRAADLQAKLDLVNPKYREASQKFTALETEQRALASELPKVETECRDAWFQSLSGACSRKDRIAKRLYEEIPPELVRLKNDLPPLAEERQNCEDTLTVLKMNLQSRQNYLARTTRPTGEQIAERERQCRSMGLSMDLDPAATKSALTISVSASEGMAGDEISLGALLSPTDPGARFGFVWSINGRVFGGNGAAVKTNIPGEGMSTVRVVAWRWAGRQWVKTAEASRDISGKARIRQAVSISGPSSVRVRDLRQPATFEARINPEVPNEQYGYTWGATGDPRGPMTFSSYGNTQSLQTSTPGRYEILVHAWKLVNGKWIFIGKASLPFTVE